MVSGSKRSSSMIVRPTKRNRFWPRTPAGFAHICCEHIKKCEDTAQRRPEGITGKYVKFLDSDDVLCPGTLKDELRLAEDNATDMVISGWGNVQIDDQLVAIPGTEAIVATA